MKILTSDKEELELRESEVDELADLEMTGENFDEDGILPDRKENAIEKVGSDVPTGFILEEEEE